jgi:geranylgeranyl diphosphate synthase type I
MDLLEKLEKERRAVNLEVQKTLVGKPDLIYSAAKHLCLAGGKMVRPMLCMLSCEAVGGKRMEVARTGAAIELMHTFTLIHDDIMDGDVLRRGQPSVHKLYGIPTAILAGDLLFSKAFEICDSRAYRILARATSEICEGQELDISFETRADVSEDEYLEMIRKKTGVLLEAACESGAVVGGGTDKQVEALASFGLSIGLAFQIQDDILGVTADEEKLGKPVGNDIVKGKKNLIAIKALEALKEKERKELLGILAKKSNTDAEINRAIQLFRDSGSIDYCKKKAREYIKRSDSSLHEIKDSTARKELRLIADYVVKRDL